MGMSCTILDTFLPQEGHVKLHLQGLPPPARKIFPSTDIFHTPIQKRTIQLDKNATGTQGSQCIVFQVMPTHIQGHPEHSHLRRRSNDRSHYTPRNAKTPGESIRRMPIPWYEVKSQKMHTWSNGIDVVRIRHQRVWHIPGIRQSRSNQIHGSTQNNKGGTKSSWIISILLRPRGKLRTGSSSLGSSHKPQPPMERGET